jgi:hypothetical protein
MIRIVSPAGTFRCLGHAQPVAGAVRVSLYCTAGTDLAQKPVRTQWPAVSALAMVTVVILGAGKVPSDRNVAARRQPPDRGGMP